MVRAGVYAAEEVRNQKSEIRRKRDRDQYVYLCSFFFLCRDSLLTRSEQEGQIDFGEGLPQSRQTLFFLGADVTGPPQILVRIV